MLTFDATIKLKIKAQTSMDARDLADFLMDTAMQYQADFSPDSDSPPSIIDDNYTITIHRNIGE